MKDVIKKIPIPICGVMLGAAALGNLLQSYSEGIRYVCGVFAAFLLILALLKLIMFPGAVKEDMKNPIMASVSGTFPMAIADAKGIRKLLYRICWNCRCISHGTCL